MTDRNLLAESEIEPERLILMELGFLRDFPLTVARKQDQMRHIQQNPYSRRYQLFFQSVS